MNQLPAPVAFALHDNILYAEMAYRLTGLPHADFYRKRAATAKNRRLKALLNHFAGLSDQAKDFTDTYFHNLMGELPGGEHHATAIHGTDRRLPAGHRAQPPAQARPAHPAAGRVHRDLPEAPE